MAEVFLKPTGNKLKSKDIKSANKNNNDSLKAPKKALDSEDFIGGLIPVLEALKKRASQCRSLFLVQNRRQGSDVKFAEILNIAKEEKLKYKWVERERLDQIYGNHSHQGVLAFFDPYAYLSLAELLKITKKEGKNQSLIVVLDRVEDPRNLGAIIRTVAAFQLDGIVIPKDRSASVSSSSLAAAAGAAEYVRVARVNSLGQSLDLLQKEGYWLVGAEGGAEQSSFNFAFPAKSALILGSEGQGLAQLSRQKCDFLVDIPLNGVINSLNVSVAGAILMYEFVKLFHNKL